MKILLLGKNGQVGWDLQQTLQPLAEVIALDRGGLDLADQDAIRRQVREHAPEIIVNAAAYTAVDRAETEPDLALAVNGVAPGVLAEEALRRGALLIHYSTDYVFDGASAAPYSEEDLPNPINAYGRTKLAGERAIASVGGKYLIFRTSWVYSHRGSNFLLKILQLAKDKDQLTVVADQFGAPTSSRGIARATAEVLLKLRKGEANLGPAGSVGESSGIYNLTASGKTSWHGFAQAILAEAHAREWVGIRPSLRIEPVTTAQYSTPARRPQNSVLDNRKIKEVFGARIGPWDKGLREVMGLVQAG